MLDGGMEQFWLVNLFIMVFGLAWQFFGMWIFLGKSLDDGYVFVCIDYIYKGFYVMVLKGSDIYYIDLFYYNYDYSVYQVYFCWDFILEEIFNCEVDYVEFIVGNIGGSSVLVGEELWIYCLVVVVMGEYIQFYGGMVADVMVVIVIIMNWVNGVYEMDIFFWMILIDSNYFIVYINSGSDFYLGGSGVYLGQNQINLDMIIGNVSYDVGYVFYWVGGGGVVFLCLVCDDEDKVWGFILQLVLVGDFFDIDYVVYELGY